MLDLTMVERKGIITVSVCAALLCLALIGCKTKQTVEAPPPPEASRVDEVAAENEADILSPMTPAVAVGDRFEIVIQRPDRRQAQRRVRAVVQDDGNLRVPGLGVISATGRTLRQLEQDLLSALNVNGMLRGTLRVSSAPIARSGLFLAAPVSDFVRVVSDNHQTRQLDRDEHATWQWVKIEADLQRRLTGGQVLSIARGDALYTLAQPAHPELADEQLAQSVSRAWTDKGSDRHVSVELKPSAAMAMENVARENRHRMLLIVIDNRVVLALTIQDVTSKKLMLTDAATSRGEPVIAQRPVQ